MWRSDTDYQAANHRHQVRSTARVMVPMMDVADLVECTPEVDRRRTAKYERLALAKAEDETTAGERAPGGTTDLVTWLKVYVTGVFRYREASETTGRR